ncbi:Prophage CP4-57 integrase [compost metagenome]
MTLAAVLKRMDLGHYTVHGFRSAFRDWAANETQFPREVAEKCLAHGLADKVEAAYFRSSLPEKRAALLTAWAAFVTGDANV